MPSSFASSTPSPSCTIRNGTSAARKRSSRGPPRSSRRRLEVSPRQAKNSSSRSDFAAFAIAMPCPVVRTSTAVAMANRTPPMTGLGML